METNIWFDFSGKDPLMLAALIACALMWAVQMVYLWAIYSRLGFHRSKEKTPSLKPVSVVVAAKNEHQNLTNHLPLILDQDYPEFEVVVVNDASVDDTSDYLKMLSLQHKNLNVVTISSNLNFFRGKKFPLALGIKSAKHELLLLTDADCKPASRNWISEMQSHFDERTQFVLGYGAYEPQRGLLDKLVRWDTVHIALQYFSFALAGSPYMGVGRNLAYRKSFFNGNKGFASHYHISGGDDDLYVNKNATASNTRICVSAGSLTFSTQPLSFGDWVKQKRRHFSTGFYYRMKHRFLLGWWPFSLLLFVALSALLLAATSNIIMVCALLLLRLISQLIIFKKAMIRLQEKKLLVLSLVFELFFIFFNAFLLMSNFIRREHKWK